MDVWAFVFTAILLLVALATCAIFISGFRDQTRPGGENDLDHRQLLKARRQMERRRGRVWWRIEELHTEFVAREGRGPAAPLPPAGGSEPAGGAGGLSGEGEEFTAADVREAFEAFLRKG